MAKSRWAAESATAVMRLMKSATVFVVLIIFILVLKFGQLS